MHINQQQVCFRSSPSDIARLNGRSAISEEKKRSSSTSTMSLPPNVHDESAICLEIAASSTRSCRLPGAFRRFKCLGTRLQVSSPFLSFFVYQPRRTPKPTSRVPRYFRRTIRYAGGSAIKEHKSLCESANDTLPLEWCLFRMRCTVAVSALCYERANHRAEQRPGTTFCIPRTMLSPTVDSAIYLD